MRFIIVVIGLLFSVRLFSQKRFVKVDSTQIYVNTIGIEDRKAGQPVVVFESGYGTPMDNWDRVLPGVSKLAPLITYDRPGIGKSEADNEMPTIKNVSDKLISLLSQLHINPPYILVGHSLGGVYVRGFANYYPDVLAGLVIIDPADFTENNQNIRDYYEVLNLDNLRVDSIITSFIDKRADRNKNAPRSIREEGEVLAELRETEFKEIHAQKLPNIPTHIITGGRFDMPKEMRSNMYDEEALFRSKMRHRVARWTDVIQSVDKGMIFYSSDAGHFVHYDDPELVIASISIVLNDYQRMQEKDKK